MHVNKRTSGNVMMMERELSAAMSALHLVHVTTVEITALILHIHVAWGVIIPVLQQQLQQQQLQLQQQQQQQQHQQQLPPPQEGL